MDVYYESLCPDSIKFINQQLYPIYEQFKNNLDITFVPHGKSDVSLKLSSILHDFKSPFFALKIRATKRHKARSSLHANMDQM